MPGGDGAHVLLRLSAQHTAVHARARGPGWLAAADAPSRCGAVQGRQLDPRPGAGEQLTTGWPPVLCLLKAVPGGEGGQAQVAAAFQSVQLLASDYMSTLPAHLLPTCLHTVSLYAQQQVRCQGCS